jgi:HAD superfamily hydrolase (TIGR01509 family)
MMPMAKRRRLKIKALLIDLDGTLVDSTHAYKEAGKAGFAAIGLADFNDDKIAFEVARRLEQDLPIDDLFTAFKKGRVVEERFLPAYLEAYYSVVHLKSKLFPKAKETLQTLSQDFSLALITLRYVLREQVMEELRRLGLKKHFRAVVTTLDVKKPKPSPDALLLAAERLRVKIQDCAIVGDSIVDVQAGKAAGAKTIAVLSGLFSREELEKQKPSLIIRDINSLPGLLKAEEINT